MATASKLDKYRLLFSCNADLDSSFRHSKPVQFNIGASKSFSGLKVESFRWNSINDNVVVSLNKFEGITFDLINQAFHKLKLKLSSWLMIFGLMMMIVCFQRPALALSGPVTRNRNLSWSSYSENGKGCSFCLKGCMVCCSTPPAKPNKSNSPFSFLKSTSRKRCLFCSFCEKRENRKKKKYVMMNPALFMAITVCIHMGVVIIMELLVVHPVFKSKSIFKIQAGLLVDNVLDRDLRLISKALEKSGSAGYKTILEDMIEVLDWHRDKLTFGYSSTKKINWEEEKECFANLLYEERKRINTRRLGTSRMIQDDDKFVVVTILVAYSGGYKLTRLRKRKDFDGVLQKLQLCNSKTDLQGLDILGLQNYQNLTATQIKYIYPLLRSLDG